MDTNKIKKVTVIVRTIGRESLAKALNSIVHQSYDVYEVIVVNAGCHVISLPSDIVQNQRIKIHRPNAPLKRSAAANFGLDHASGEYCLFLDDDDWLHTEHVHRLVDKLSSNPKAIMAYSGIECIQADSLLQTHVFDSPFSYSRLLVENYIPIHAALFKRMAWEQGCRFDETLDIHEDWDFWIQLARLADFVHCPGVSATYVLSGEGSGVWQKQDHIENSILRIYEKWWEKWTAQGIFEYLQTLREDLLTSHEQISALHQLSAVHAQEQQVALSESIQYTTSLKSNLEEKQLEFTEQTRQLEIALLESNQYASSLKYHLDIKEMELKDAHDKLAALSVKRLPHSRKTD